MEYEDTNLSDLIEEHGWADRQDEINEMVHDALAIEHYPTYGEWKKEYVNGYKVFLAMRVNRRRLMELVGEEYERFIYSHRDL